jgi:DNA-binding transcriptional LysR family regulator
MSASAPSLTDLQAFAAVARWRSFRRAAQELGVSPSALTHSLRALEARLGVRLLHRTTRSVAPTEAGERLLQQLSPALQALQGALDSLNPYRDEPQGTLRINAPRAARELVLAPLLHAFLHAHPGMRVELASEDALVDIVAAGYDAGVRFGERLQQDMVAVPLGPAQRFLVVGSPSFLARHGAPASPHALTTLPCVRIRFPAGHVYRWEFARDGETLEVEVDGPWATDDMRVMVQAAEAGLGLAYVYAQYAAEGLAQGRLQSVLEDWCPNIPGFYLYYPSRRLMPAGLRAFVDWVRTSPSRRR